MKRILALVLVLVLIPAVWALAATNCSVITYAITNVSTPSKAGCTGWQGYTPGGYAYYETLTLHVAGYQTQTGVTYASANLPLTQIGHCWVQLSGAVKDCNPLYTVVKTTPLAATGTNYDMIGFQSLDGVQHSSSTCGISYGATQFWQCLAKACTSPPPPRCYPVDQCDSPIIIDISGEGFHLTDAANGVSFDIKGTGEPLQMGWTARGAENAFLALPGPDGLVHSGKELFGNQQPYPNGFEKLAVYDSNHDGVIDARDPVFKSLRLWVDENHNGASEPGELHTLEELGVNSISLKYKEEPWHDQYGNAFRYRARLNPEHPDQDGKWTVDVFFVSLCK